MVDFAMGAFKLSTAHWTILLLLCGSGYAIIAQMMDSQGPAAFGFPMMVVGCAFGQHAMSFFDWRLADDKVVNAGIGMAGGFLGATLLLVFILWISTVIVMKAQS